MSGLVIEWDGNTDPEIKSGIAKFKFGEEMECVVRLDSFSDFRCVSQFIEDMYNNGRAEGMADILMDLKEFVRDVEAE